MYRDKTTNKPSKRQIQQERVRKQRVTTRLTWIGVGVVILAVVGVLAWQATRPTQSTDIMGEEIPIPSRAHIAESMVPGPYPSDPPAGGVHYASTLPAKFYQESDMPAVPPYPQGYLVHNLEHGYVIFWYNCDALQGISCDELKSQIQGVIDEFDGVKVMAFPWHSIEEPVVATSWGRLLRFDEFDPSLASRFVRSNRFKAPEPDAP